MSKNILLTGANRGIGLEITKQLQAKGFEITALVRKSSVELNALNCNVIENVEITDLESIKAAQAQINAITFSSIWNIAGLLQRETIEEFGQSAFTSMEQQFQVNALGPLKLSSVFLDQLEDNGKLIMLTSRMGSVEDNTSGGRYGYRMSKAALNIASKSLAHDLAPRNIAVGIFHPGWVQTEMTGNTGNLTAAESAALLIQRYEELNMENTGTFFHANGEVLPW